MAQHLNGLFYVNALYYKYMCTFIDSIFRINNVYVHSWFKSENLPDNITAQDRHSNCFNEKAYDSFEKYHHPLYNVVSIPRELYKKYHRSDFKS